MLHVAMNTCPRNCSKSVRKFRVESKMLRCMPSIHTFCYTSSQSFPQCAAIFQAKCITSRLKDVQLETFEPKTACTSSCFGGMYTLQCLANSADFDVSQPFPELMMFWQVLFTKHNTVVAAASKIRRCRQCHRLNQC